MTRPKPNAPRSASRARDAVLRLDAEVYTEAAVERTCRAFAELATIEVRGGKRQWTVRFTEMAPDLAARLPDEFANHALSCLMVDR